MTTTTILLGASIRPQGQPTAIAVAQQSWATGLIMNKTSVPGSVKPGKRLDYYTVRFLEVIPARTSYPTIARRLGEIVENLHTQAAQYKARVVLYAEVTGLGDPVVDLIKARADPIYTVRLTNTDKRSESGTHLTVGKPWLISRLQTLFQGNRVVILDTPATQQLRTELLSYSLPPAPEDNELGSTLIVGTQDELLTALGLACQGLPPDELGAQEFLDFMHRKVHHFGNTQEASKDWLREWQARNPGQQLDPNVLPRFKAPSPSPSGVVPHG